MKAKYIQFVVLLSIIMTSCTEWLTVQPKTEITREEMFKTVEGFEDALTGVYVLLRDNYSPDGQLMSQALDRMACLWYYASTDDASFSNHNYRQTLIEQSLGKTFLNQYKAIVNDNSLITALDESKNVLKPDDKKRIHGEALGLRAFLHFDVIRLWGPMPTDVSSTELILPYAEDVRLDDYPYSTYSDYMSKIIRDLDMAEDMLKDVDPIVTSANMNLIAQGQYRQNCFNYYAVLALKARVYLWMNDKAKALQYAKMVVDVLNGDGTPKFSLGTRSDLLNGDRLYFKEHIFGIHIESFNDNMTFANSRNPTTVQTKSRILDELFEGESELRTDNSLWYENYIYNYGGYVWGSKKYSGMQTESNSGLWMSIPLIRLSEMYLIIAECADLSQANTYFDTFLTSRLAGIRTLTDANRSDLILREYLKEFLAEGQAFYVYKRMAKDQMRWCPDVCDKTVYVLPLPKRELSNLDEY